jgi:hypothetical protein
MSSIASHSSYKDGNGQGMGKIEQCNTHTHIVDGYKILPVPVPMGIKLYPYPAGTHTHWVPNGYIKYYTCYSPFLLSLIVYWELDHEISVSSRHVDYGQCLITRVIEVWDAELL